MLNIKKATIWGLILFFLILVLTSIIIIFTPEIYINITMLLFFPFLIFFFSKFMYFRKEETDAIIKEGCLVGMYWSIISIICDIIFVVYLFGFGWELFLIWGLYLHYAEIFIFTILGALTEKKKQKISIKDKI